METFIEVVNLKSFSKAAEKMFLTQPTITNHIQSLEEELGTLLINRSGKRISVTDAGSILYRYALEIVNMRDLAQFNLNEYEGKIEGHLEISTSSIPEQYVIPHILKEFIEQYPNVTFTINHEDSKRVVEDITNGYINYGIVGAKYDSDALEYIDFFEDHLIVVVPNNENYVWKPYETLDIGFLLKQKIILREKGSGTRLLVEKALKEKNLKIDSLDIISCIEDNETIKKLVELGLGISFISEIAVQKEIKLGLIKPYYIKDLELKRKFYFVYHKNRYLSPLAQEFKNFVIEYTNNFELNSINC